MPSGTVEVWLPTQDSDVKGALPALGKNRIKVSQIELDLLSQNFAAFLGTFQNHLPTAVAPKSGYAVDSIEVNLGINATGGIAIIGKLEAGAQAGIKIVLRCTPKE